VNGFEVNNAGSGLDTFYYREFQKCTTRQNVLSELLASLAILVKVAKIDVNGFES